MDQLILKKAIFYPREIVLIKKKGNITISIENIESISYHKPNIYHYLSGLFVAGSLCKIFEIDLKQKINGKKLYCLIVEYQDILKLQKFFQKEIFIN